MRVQKKFSLLFNVTERYADYVFSEERNLSSPMAREVGKKLNLPLDVLLFSDCREGRKIADILTEALENVDIPIPVTTTTPNTAQP